MFYFCTLICTGLVVASKSYSIIQERKDLGLEEPSHQPLLPLPSPLLRSPPFFHSPRRFSYIQQPSTAVKPHESQLSFTLPFLALPYDFYFNSHTSYICYEVLTKGCGLVQALARV